MLITFKTKSYANITMLGEAGSKMLEFMDFGAKVPGAIAKHDLPEALDNLTKALAKLPDEVEQPDPNSDEPVAVSLKARAFPLIQLLQSAIDDENNVMWE